MFGYKGLDESYYLSVLYWNFQNNNYYSKLCIFKDYNCTYWKIICLKYTLLIVKPLNFIHLKYMPTHKIYMVN